METRRGLWSFWSWSCRLLLALRCVCQCLNSGPLKEQHVLLTSTVPNFLQFTCIIFYHIFLIPLIKLKMCLYILSSLRSYIIESILGSPICEHLGIITDYLWLPFLIICHIRIQQFPYFQLFLHSHVPVNVFIGTSMYQIVFLKTKKTLKSFKQYR